MSRGPDRIGGDDELDEAGRGWMDDLLLTCSCYILLPFVLFTLLHTLLPALPSSFKDCSFSALFTYRYEIQGMGSRCFGGGDLEFLRRMF